MRTIRDTSDSWDYWVATVWRVSTNRIQNKHVTQWQTPCLQYEKPWILKKVNLKVFLNVIFTKKYKKNNIQKNNFKIKAVYKYSQFSPL